MSLWDWSEKKLTFVELRIHLFRRRFDSSNYPERNWMQSNYSTKNIFLHMLNT